MPQFYPSEGMVLCTDHDPAVGTRSLKIPGKSRSRIPLWGSRSQFTKTTTTSLSQNYCMLKEAVQSFSAVSPSLKSATERSSQYKGYCENAALGDPRPLYRRQWTGRGMTAWTSPTVKSRHLIGRRPWSLRIGRRTSTDTGRPMEAAFACRAFCIAGERCFEPAGGSPAALGTVRRTVPATQTYRQANACLSYDSGGRPVKD